MEKNIVINRSYLLITLLGIIISSGTYTAPQEDNINDRLLTVVKNGNSVQVIQLLQAGADVNHQNRYGETPLFYAVRENHASIIQLLIAHDADVNHQDPNGLTPLFNAHRRDLTSTAQLLIAHGADANHQNQRGETPLSQAAQNGLTSIAQLLLNAGADVNHQSQRGFTPLFDAAQNGHTSIAQLLLNAGATVNHQNSYGETPLFAAAQKPSVIRYPRKIRQFMESSLLSFVPQSRRISTAQLLLNAGAAVNHQNQHSFTPLHYAAQNGYKPIVRLLLARGAHWPKKPRQIIKDNADAFNERKEAIEGFFQKLDTDHNMPPDVLGLLKKFADVPEEHGPLGTGGRFKALKREREQHSTALAKSESLGTGEGSKRFKKD